MKKFQPWFAIAIGLAIAATARFLAVEEGPRTSGIAQLRKIWGEAYLPDVTRYTASPFIVDQILGPGAGPRAIFDSASQAALAGDADLSFRCFSPGVGSLSVVIKTEAAGWTPRVWLYNEEGRLVSAGNEEKSADGDFIRYRLNLSGAGLYRLRCKFRFEDVESIVVEGSIPYAALSFAEYAASRMKRFEFDIPSSQWQTFRKILTQQNVHWQAIAPLPPERFLPSTRERVTAKIRAPGGAWSYATIGLAGRNPQHASGDGASIDVRIEAGSLPYGLQRFKLYTLLSKTGGKDMIMESILADTGLPEYRQDLALVEINGGEFTWFANLLEGIEAPYFEYAQVAEGPMVGYDTDALIARPGQSHFKLRNFSGIRAAGADLDLTDPAFADSVDTTQMAIALAFASTYAGNHGMGNDMRFHQNPRLGVRSPVVKDFNSGVDHLSYGRALAALRLFATMAPDWRPHVATYSSYFILRNESGDTPSDFFWWNVMPPNLAFYGDPDRFKRISAFLKWWGSETNQYRIAYRLDNFRQAAAAIDALGKGALSQKIDSSIVQPLHTEVSLDSFIDSSLSDAPLGALAQSAKSLLAQIDLDPDDRSLRQLQARNDAVIEVAKRGIPQSQAFLLEKTQNPVVTFFYREETAAATRLVFLGRNVQNGIGGSFILKTADGDSLQPVKTASGGTRDSNPAILGLLLNHLIPDESVALWRFDVPRASDHQYLQPVVSDNLSFFGPREFTVGPAWRREPGVVFLDPATYFDQAGDIWTWKADAPAPEGVLKIPRHVTWQVPRPQTVEFGPDGMMLVHGRLEIGEESHLTLKARGESWNGIHFHDTPDLTIARLTVEGIGSGSETIVHGRRTYTGALSFYNTRVKLSDTVVRDIRLEDGIHFLRSEVDLRNVRVEKTQSDGIDADFCVLRVDGLFMEEIGSLGEFGGDGLDVSGSLLELTNGSFESGADKGISVGENATVNINNTVVRGTDIGVAVKDGSFAEIANSRLTDNRFGIALYIKKPYYPAPRLVVGPGMNFEGNRLDHVAFRFGEDPSMATPYALPLP